MTLLEASEIVQDFTKEQYNKHQSSNNQCVIAAILVWGFQSIIDTIEGKK